MHQQSERRGTEDNYLDWKESGRLFTYTEFKTVPTVLKIPKGYGKEATAAVQF